MTQPTVINARVDSEVKDLLRKLAAKDGLSETQALEHAILDTAIARGVLLPGAASSSASLKDLERNLLPFLDSHKSMPPDNITRLTFLHIQGDVLLTSLHAAAITPNAPQILPSQRRKYVHQRLGRFIKDYLKLRAQDEVKLPKGSAELIQSFTRLIP